MNLDILVSWCVGVDFIYTQTKRTGLRLFKNNLL